MMISPCISVIVPVYNAEAYLKDCLNSIVRQTYKNLEIILVDDGAKDSSGFICDEFAAVDNRIVVIHRENEGVSSARNHGLEIATGELIAFVDADDVLPVDAYENLINCGAAEHIVMGRMQLMSEHGELLESSRSQWQKEVLKDELLTDLFAERKFTYLGFAWDKLYKRSIIEQDRLRFEPDILLNEDRLFVFQYLMHCEKMFFCDDVVYYYRQRSSELIDATGRTRVLDKRDITVIKAFEKMQEIAKAYSEDLYALVCLKSFESALDMRKRVTDKLLRQTVMRFMQENLARCLTKTSLPLGTKVKLIIHRGILR